MLEFLTTLFISLGIQSPSIEQQHECYKTKSPIPSVEWIANEIRTNNKAYDEFLIPNPCECPESIYDKRKKTTVAPSRNWRWNDGTLVQCTLGDPKVCRICECKNTCIAARRKNWDDHGPRGEWLEKLNKHEKDHKEEWLHKLEVKQQIIKMANNGNAAAAYKLGLNYKNNISGYFEEDAMTRSISWFEKAAMYGHEDAKVLIHLSKEKVKDIIKSNINHDTEQDVLNFIKYKPPFAVCLPLKKRRGLDRDCFLVARGLKPRLIEKSERNIFRANNLVFSSSAQKEIIKSKMMIIDNCRSIMRRDGRNKTIYKYTTRGNMPTKNKFNGKFISLDDCWPSK